MRKYIQQYGKQRTGTNYVKALLATNFDNVVLFDNRLGSKHQAFKPVRVWMEETGIHSNADFEQLLITDRCWKDRNIVKQSNTFDHIHQPINYEELIDLRSGRRKLDYIISIKNPYAFAVSVNRWHSLQNVISWKELRKPPSTDPLDPEVISEQCLEYNQVYRSYLPLLQSGQGLLIRHEDIVDDCLASLCRIKEFFGLSYKHNEPIGVYTNVAPVIGITNDQFYHSYYLEKEYMKALSSDMVSMINDVIDWDLMSHYGYHKHLPPCESEDGHDGEGVDDLGGRRDFMTDPGRLRERVAALRAGGLSSGSSSAIAHRAAGSHLSHLAVPDERRRARILAVGDAVVPTGLARVAEALLRRLGDAFDIVQLGTNYSGDPHPLPWPVYQARRDGDLHGTRRLGRLIAELKPDLVWIINDLAIVAEYLAALGDTKPLPPIVAYCPLEAGPVEPVLLDRLAGLTRLVLYADFAEAAFEAALARRARRNGSAAPFPALDVIPHGVDITAFRPIGGAPERPIPDRARVRASLWPKWPELADAFIVLNANRNQPRKQIDITLRGFALFAKDKPPSVKLCLHMGRKDLGWDIRTVAAHLGLGSRLIFDARWPGPPRLDDAALNLIYNACEVGLNTANAEGWGLVAFEHAATGAAQVVPAFSAPGEIWRDAAELLKPSATLHNPALSFEERIIAPQTVAAALERLYRDPDLRAERARQAHAVATDPRYGWDNLAVRWRRILSDTIGATARPAPDPAPNEPGLPS